VTDRSALRHHQARVGKREEVLVEGPSRRNDQMLSGRTRQGKLIHFPVTETRCARDRSPAWT
jgi:tRNA-2-methylthio-N6-dimethylallyladenosine synthase